MRPMLCLSVNYAQISFTISGPFLLVCQLLILALAHIIYLKPYLVSALNRFPEWEINKLVSKNYAIGKKD